MGSTKGAEQDSDCSGILKGGYKKIICILMTFSLKSPHFLCINVLRSFNKDNRTLITLSFEHKVKMAVESSLFAGYVRHALQT